jgi:formylglycine-generating enzyme required for sulfatase activity
MKKPPTGHSRIRFVAMIAMVIAHLLCGPADASAQDAVAGQTRNDLLQGFVEDCVLIEPGTEKFPQQFQLGRHFESPFALPECTVTMSQSFRISKFEMTQGLYAAITGANPSRWNGPRNSVESMSFLDAEMFCTKLTAQLRAANLITPNDVVRLPTEAEWEYCCRAGTDTQYSFGDSASTDTDGADATSILNEYAWHTGNAAGNDPAVGVLKPNPWGLFDMHGYLWEYVSDKYTVPNAGDSRAPDRIIPGATTRIIRSGSWRDHASLLTSGARLPIPDHVSSDAIGFRCVIAQKSQP